MISLDVTETINGVARHVGVFHFDKAVVTCGRRYLCDLRYPHANAASIQCSFTREQDATYVRAALSAGATYFKGKPVQRAPIQPGERVYFGHWCITLLQG